jgi:hypothetical protein
LDEFDDEEDIALDDRFNEYFFDGNGDVFDNLYELSAERIRELYYAGEISNRLALGVLDEQAAQGDEKANEVLLELDPELAREAEFDMDGLDDEFNTGAPTASALPVVNPITGEIIEWADPNKPGDTSLAPADAMSFEIDELAGEHEFALGAMPEDTSGIYAEPVPFWRKMLGLGPMPQRDSRVCNHYMPIAHKRCVLRAGHPATVHHTSVRQRHP